MRLSVEQVESVLKESRTQGRGYGEFSFTLTRRINALLAEAPAQPEPPANKMSVEEFQACARKLWSAYMGEEFNVCTCEKPTKMAVNRCFNCWMPLRESAPAGPAARSDDEEKGVCPECGNEEVHPGTGLWTCECHAPFPATGKPTPSNREIAHKLLEDFHTIGQNWGQLENAITSALDARPQIAREVSGEK